MVSVCVMRFVFYMTYLMGMMLRACESKLLTQAFFAGCIPVILSDDFQVPFADLLDSGERARRKITYDVAVLIVQEAMLRTTAWFYCRAG